MKILMVCLGNICRSPIAEGVLRQLASEAHLEIEIDSAGTASYHEGQQADRRSISCMRQHDIDISAHRARQVQPADLEYYNAIYAMDIHNLNDLLRLADSPEQRHKMKLLLAVTEPLAPKNVPDPYYGDASDFEAVFSLCAEACSAIIDDLMRSKDA